MTAAVIPPTPTMTGDDVRRIRNRLGLTVDQFAAKVGVSPGVISSAERSATPLKILTENAIRFVAMTGGPDLPTPCAECDGAGFTRVAVKANPHAQPRRVRCADCQGEGLAEPSGRVIA